MKYGVLFLLLLLATAVFAAQRGGWWWTLLYPSLSFGIVAAAYLGLGAILFGKQKDGRLAFLAVMFLIPGQSNRDTQPVESGSQ